MAKAKRTTKDPWKMKKWFEVYAPESFNNILIAETPAQDSKLLPGRVVQCTLADLSGDSHDFKKQRLKLFFSIREVKGKEARTDYTGHEITRDYERSITRRHGTKIDTNDIVQTNDEKRIRVKAILSTGKNVHVKQVKAIRDIATKTLQKSASEANLDNFVQELLYGKMGSKIYRKGSKIYPLKTVIIRKTEVLA